MIDNIRLQKFRSYTDESFEFSKGVNIIVGPNTSGKTNLLEAVLVLCAGQSYRARDTELIKFGKPWARLDVDLPTGRRSLRFVKQSDGGILKTLTINHETIKRMTAGKKIPVVLFEPNHLQLFQEGPEARRDYMDEFVEQLNHTFGALRNNYRRTLAQRNRLLKQHPTGVNNQLFGWNIRLSELGGQMVAHRKALIDQINHHLPKLYKDLSGSTTNAVAAYESKLSLGRYSSALLHKLEAGLDVDLARGFTTYGPHRDDMLVSLNGHPMQESASRGEVRTLLLALKIIELRLLEDTYDTKPILLLDDVFSELDGARRQALTKVIQGYQTFITTTDADIVVQHFLEKCTIIPLQTKRSATPAQKN